MKIIFKIARAELKLLFHSPVAWVVFVVFLVVSGLRFVYPLMEMARIQEVKINFSPDWPGFEGPLTWGLMGASIQQFLRYFYLFIPLLTMGVINREVNSGTIKLLYSSPIRLIDLVLGKYLGLFIFNLALLSSITLLLFTGYFTIQHAELSWYLSMLLGLFLLSSAYMSIGLFISCLTNYQMVAGISTFVVFFILTMIGEVFQEIGFIRDITYFLSLAGRTESMLSGLITTRDVLYFLLIIILFLGLSVIRLQNIQESRPWAVRIARNLAIIVVILTLGYFSSRPGYIGYYDVTRDQRNTIDTATRQVLLELDGSPITVTLYTNLLGSDVNKGIPKARNNYVWNFWAPYVRFYPNIHLRYEYYYDIKDGDSSLYKRSPGKDIHHIAKQRAKLIGVDVADFMKPGEIDKLVDLKGEEMNLILEFEYKGKKEFLRFPKGSSGPTQQMFSGTIRRLVRDNIPLILFSSGHYERSPYRNGEREYGMHTNAKEAGQLSLINLGVDIDTVNLGTEDIPDHTAALVVADPKSSLSSQEQDKISAFIEKGGNVLFYGEPGKQEKLNPLLNKIGVNLDDGILVRPARNILSEFFPLHIIPEANRMSREPDMQVYQRGGPLGAEGKFLSTATISYRELNGFDVQPIVKEISDKFPTWIENGVFVSDSARPVFSALEGDIKKDEYILGVKLTRTINNKEQRIIVMADADFMSPRGLNGAGIGKGFYSWLLYNEYPVYTRLVLPLDKYLTIGKKTGISLHYTYVYVLPALVALIGAVILIRRKRK